jgi:hypothetical protein
MVPAREKQEDLLFDGVVRFNIKMFGLVLGIMSGMVIFVATNYLVVKGGYVAPNGDYVIGPHLQLLSQLFFGYRVSFLGSFVGFAYGFAIGTLCGGVIGWVYSRIVEFRQ